MTKINPTNVTIMRIYSLGAQRRALLAFLEVTVAHWSLDVQDALALLGTDACGDLGHYQFRLLPAHTQLALHEFGKIAKAYRLMPYLHRFNGIWLNQPSHSFAGQAPIDLMLAEGRFGVKKVADFLTDKTVRQVVTSVEGELEQ